MARNSEKAVTALARWRNLQLKEQGKLFDDRRPLNVNDEFSLKKAERWRNQVIRDIAKKVTQIQNAGLGEFKIRDLNDEINKLLKEKSAWEDRIVELGGPDYKKVGPKLLDKEGKEVPGNKGYKYFGAAKELPGVKELFEQETVEPTKKSKADLMREIDAEYYGYLDEEDYLLLPQEEKCEREARRKKIEEFKAKAQNEPVEETNQMETDELKQSISDEEDEDLLLYSGYDKKSQTKNIHIDVPTLKDVENAILEKKKLDLLRMYVSPELLETENQVKQLAGKV
ncbi:unnamed protein product [Brachionus calyciflorus]|uniref:ISY1 n=2 Tax=Brachionus calyciflorus TaxID=104777 RepID=A0A813QQZ0_9BILA|nr:unnamed protein product [Brachionus calyciflorus]